MNLEHIFKYHAPTAEQQMSYVVLRDKAKQFAEAVIAHVPAGADQTAAIRKIREAVMTANAGVALSGRLD